MAKIRCFRDIQEGKNDILFVKGVKFLLIFNALVLGPKLDFLAQYRYFFYMFQNMIHTIIFARNFATY